jgi:hypothetical protein
VIEKQTENPYHPEFNSTRRTPTKNTGRFALLLNAALVTAVYTAAAARELAQLSRMDVLFWH